MEHMPPAHSPDEGETPRTPDMGNGWPISSADERSHGAPSGAFADESRFGAGRGPAAVELEPGWAASRALMRIASDELLAVMLRPSFRPVKDLDLVPVSRCPHCLDGGLRTAGSVRTRQGREPVRACDTCAAVEIGTGPVAPHP